MAFLTFAKAKVWASFIIKGAKGSFLGEGMAETCGFEPQGTVFGPFLLFFSWMGR